MISVLTPSFNSGRFISDSLESVRRQGSDPIEHVVQDGGSSDATESLVASYPSISWLSQEDEGQSDALNRALKRSSGSWIAWLNADEFYLPDALETLRVFGEASRSDVVFGDTAFVDEHGRLLRLVPQHRHNPRVLRSYGLALHTCATLFRRDVLGNAPFDTSLRRLMDWDLFLRLDRAGARITYLPIPVGAYRVHKDQVTAIRASVDSEEHRYIAARHGTCFTKSGTLLHAALKATDHSYKRQRRARQYEGKDFRWFASQANTETVRDFSTRCYKSRHEATPIL